MKTPTTTHASFPSVLFSVCRPCDDGLCPEGTFVCSCHAATDSRADVDELTLEEERYFRTHGTAAQKAALAAYYSAPALAPLTRAEHAHLDAAA